MKATDEQVTHMKEQARLAAVDAELRWKAALVPALAAALNGLLETAELNQDDLEGDTRYQIENANVVLACVEPPKEPL